MQYPALDRRSVGQVSTGELLHKLFEMKGGPMWPSLRFAFGRYENLFYLIQVVVPDIITSYSVEVTRPRPHLEALPDRIGRCYSLSTP